MGTTVTTNLGLIKPDSSESIKQNLPSFAGWAAQNAINMDKIDPLFRADGITNGLTFSASGGGFTLGAGGFVTTKVMRFAPRMAMQQVVVACGGAGFAAGTGFYQLTGFSPSIDPALNNFAASGGLPLGVAVFGDFSAILTSSVFSVIYNLAGTIFFRLPDASIWNNTNPVVLAQNDRMSCYFTYPTTDA